MLTKLCGAAVDIAVGANRIRPVDPAFVFQITWREPIFFPEPSWVPIDKVMPKRRVGLMELSVLSSWILEFISDAQ
jgi:hypothetical protein